MIRSLYTAATGMKANQLYIDNISNNLSNVNTMGFKKSRVDFEDLIYQNQSEAGAQRDDGTSKPAGLQVGLGVAPVANQKIFTQGSLTSTGNPTDIAVHGDGFLQISMPNGETSYTRDGSLKVSHDGYLVNSQGYLLEPNISLPETYSNLTISSTGTVAVNVPGEDLPLTVGEIETARFVNPVGLKSLGGNLYQMTEASGLPVVDTPGNGSHGTLANQYLESSNVQLVEEMVNMIVAQRAYEVSSKSITTADDMLQTTNQLKR
jgi:flagellar basal-body rod protein FlgG